MNDIVFDTNHPLPCPLCGKVAVVPLPEKLRAQQTDGTTHVCFPFHPFNGCNHGFAMEIQVVAVPYTPSLN